MCCVTCVSALALLIVCLRITCFNVFLQISTSVLHFTHCLSTVKCFCVPLVVKMSQMVNFFVHLYIDLFINL